MSALTDFYDILMPELPGCTTAMVDLHLREVAREFCRSTSVWRQTLTAINLVANQATYTVAVPINSELVQVLSVTANGITLWINTDFPEPLKTPKYTRADPPFTMSGDLLTLTFNIDEIPSSTVTAGLVLTGALTPSATTTVIPDFIKAQYSDAIRFGVLSRLLAMGKKPWTDRDLAVNYAQKWNSAMNFAAMQANTGSTRAPLRVKMWR